MLRREETGGGGVGEREEVYSCMFCLKPWTPVTVSFSYSRSIPRQVVESRVESVLWQENGRMHWWRRNIIISLIRGCQLTIVCDMETKFDYL